MKNERPGPKSGQKRSGKPEEKFASKRGTSGDFSPKKGPKQDKLGAFSPQTGSKRSAAKPGDMRSKKTDAAAERGATQAFPPKRYINVYFSLGSNLGDRQANLRAAVLLIDKNIGKVARKSKVYETEPWGEPAQDKFLNQVIMANTTLQPRDLLEIIAVIEKELGRVKKEKWGPRTIDIDILFYGKRVVRDKGLDIPHPELHKRNFVLVPLLEIAPDLEHPVLKQPIDELYLNCKDPGEVVQLD